MAWLILSQLDGELRSLSLNDVHNSVWNTQLHGGQLLQCGERNNTEAECKMWARRPSLSTCSRCSPTLRRSCEDGIMSKSNTHEKEFVSLCSQGNEKMKCCLVSSTDVDTIGNTPTQKWYFYLDSPVNPSSHDDSNSDNNDNVDSNSGEAVGINVDELLHQWNDNSCPLHKAVELLHKEMLYVELDFFTGRVLSYFSNSDGYSNTDFNTPRDDDDDVSLRLLVKRTDISRSVMFPPQRVGAAGAVVPSSLINDNSSEENKSHTWFALNSNVELELLESTIHNDLPYEPWLHAAYHSLFYIDQTPTIEGVSAYLRSSAELEKFTELKLEISSPIISAYLVWIDPSTNTTNNNDDGNSGNMSFVRCEKIPVVVSPGFPRKNILVKRPKLQKEEESEEEENNNYKTEEIISGFLDNNSHVLFVESNEVKNMWNSPQKTLSSLYASEDMDSHSSSHTEDSENDEGRRMFLLNEDNSDITEEIFSNSGTTENAMVLYKGNNSSKQSNRTDTNALVPTCIESSFFDENFEVKSILGRGASGVVLLTRHRVTGVLYAVKVMLTRDYFTENDVLREVRLHAHLQSKYLVRYFGCWSEAITPFRVLQLARIGLCSRREVKEVCGKINLNLINTQRETPLNIEENTNWMLPPLPLPTSTTSTVALTGNVCNLLLGPPPPQEKDTVNYLAGDESMDESSAASCSSEDDRTIEDESSEVSSSENSVGKFLGRVVFLQLEYCQTTLAHRLGSRTEIDRLENMIIALQLFAGLRYIHKCGCLHRDVKPTNVFLDYRSQMGIIDDMSDENSGERSGDDDDYDYGVEEEEETVVRNGCTHETELADGKRLPDLFAPSPSAFDFLKRNIHMGLLAVYLRQLRDAKHERKKQKILRSIRVWLKRRLVQVRIGDFGLAKPLSDQRVDLAGYFDSNTINTVGIGSPIYSSPEQLNGDICTPATDTFAAGIVLAEMYLLPKTISERLVELRRVRDGTFSNPHILKMYPELAVVQGLTHSNPQKRMKLRDASRILAKIVDNLLLSFFQSDDDRRGTQNTKEMERSQSLSSQS